MGLFGKTNKKNDYDEKQRALNEDQLASDRLIIFQLNDDDKKAGELVGELKKGKPLVLNFDNLEPMAANKLLAFFAGACFAIDGRNVRINEKTYLFARNVDFYDGSLQHFLDTLPRE